MRLGFHFLSTITNCTVVIEAPLSGEIQQLKAQNTEIKAQTAEIVQLLRGKYSLSCTLCFISQSHFRVLFSQRIEPEGRHFDLTYN